MHTQRSPLRATSPKGSQAGGLPQQREGILRVNHDKVGFLFDGDARAGSEQRAHTGKEAITSKAASLKLDASPKLDRTW